LNLSDSSVSRLCIYYCELCKFFYCCMHLYKCVKLTADCLLSHLTITFNFRGPIINTKVLRFAERRSCPFQLPWVDNVKVTWPALFPDLLFSFTIFNSHHPLFTNTCSFHWPLKDGSLSQACLLWEAYPILLAWEATTVITLPNSLLLTYWCLYSWRLLCVRPYWLRSWLTVMPTISHTVLICLYSRRLLWTWSFGLQWCRLLSYCTLDARSSPSTKRFRGAISNDS